MDGSERSGATVAGGARESRESRRWLALPAAASVLYVVLALHAAKLETPTVDEFAHVPAGLAAWRHGRTDLYRSNPPLFKMLLAAPLALDPTVVAPAALEPAMAWGPWEYGHRFMNANRDRYLALMFRARCVAVLVGLLAGGLVLAWAREVFGVRAAAIVASLFLLCPNVLAHGHLATIDMAALATVLLAAYALRRAYRSPTWPRLGAAGAALGLALAVKFVALLLVPAFAIFVAAQRWRAEGPPAARLARAGADAVALGAAALLVLHASVAFSGSFAPLGSFALSSRFAKSLQTALPAALPVPVPREYLLGFDAAKEMQERGEFGSYLLGRWSERGWWYYNLVALGVKLPLATLLLLAAAAPFWRRSRIDRGELLAIALPLATLLVVFSTSSNLNIGIRHVLPALPFAFLLLGPIFATAAGRTRSRTTAAAAAAALLAAAGNAAAIHPDYLTFFNAIAGGPSRGSEWLLDSNLDWGQDLYRVPAAVAAIDPEAPLYLLYFGHVDPALYGLRYELPPAAPVAGLVAVSENFLGGASYLTVAPGGAMTGVAGDRAAWLRTRKPALRIGSILVYDTRVVDRRMGLSGPRGSTQR
jgi:4-amino-4-deoxy-L-arabinose transferase-like glycosyltransferase